MIARVFLRYVLRVESPVGNRRSHTYYSPEFYKSIAAKKLVTPTL